MVTTTPATASARVEEMMPGEKPSAAAAPAGSSNRTAVIVVSTVVGVLGLISVALGFAAEANKITPADVSSTDAACIYPATPAFGMGITSALFLVLAQIIVSAASGCCGCCNSSSPPASSSTKRVVAIICAVISWLMVVVATALFLDGAAWNASVVRQPTDGLCYYLKTGTFAAAGVLALVGLALSLASYIIFFAQQPASPVPATGIAMGRPAAAPAMPAGFTGAQGP